MSPEYLVVLFQVTGGQNGENLGSDEEEVVFFVYLLYDIASNKVVCVQSYYCRPTQNELRETILTEECKIVTGLNEDLIKSAFPLEQVLDEFERFLVQKELHPHHGGSSFYLCCDGQLHLRLVLHPEAQRKNISLPSYFYKFFDLRKAFKEHYKVETVHCIKDMLDHLNLEVDQSVEYGVRHCQDMAKIIQRLLDDRYQFSDPETISNRLEPGICSKSENVDDDTVIRARGLPWQSSDQDIALFFKGLNIIKGGVALCLSPQGRRNGEALIRFECKEHRDLALRKHKHHLGQRYIEVYKASGKDFINVAGGGNAEAQQFLEKHNNEGQVIVRMRGLPYSASSQQIIDFFQSGPNSVQVLDGQDGVLFVHHADGRATGDAFVLFANDEQADVALLKHRECIGSRYIELFKSTTAEVQQVLNRSMDPRAHAMEAGVAQTVNVSTAAAASFIDASAATQMALMGYAPPTNNLLPLPQQMITTGSQKDCIRLRGLPFECNVTDILAFLGEYSKHIVLQGVHMVINSTGAPSGEAFIQMESEIAAEATSLAKHRKTMTTINGVPCTKKRYVEVLQCSGDEMNIILTNGLPSVASPVATAPLLQAVAPSPQRALMPTPTVPTHPAILSPPMAYPAPTFASPINQRSIATTTLPNYVSPLPATVNPYQPFFYLYNGYPSPPVSPPTEVIPR